MKTIMSCKIILCILFALTFNVEITSAQQNPTGSPIANVNYNDWYKGGNIGNATKPNIFGTFWNSPIYTYTNSTMRMKINGAFAASGPNTQYTINGFNWNSGVNTTGYVGIGMNDPILTNSPLLVWTTKGPFSLLHLNGDNYQHVQELGYRPWMKIGMTVTSNDDLMYVGHKRVSNDVTDAVFAWSDNAGTSWGPDNLLFIF
ncbi:MAG TPA: hypothetical protein PKI01_05930 [Bacteroidales bacterium]|nr:hypothetical protein [Bacteroidales bacterium]